MSSNDKLASSMSSADRELEPSPRSELLRDFATQNKETTRAVNEPFPSTTDLAGSGDAER